MSSSPKGEESRLFPSEENKNDGYLGLLVETARLISGNFEDEESEPKTSSEKGGLIHEASGDSQMRADQAWEKPASMNRRRKESRKNHGKSSIAEASCRVLTSCLLQLVFLSFLPWPKNTSNFKNDDNDDMNAEAEAAVAEASLVFNPS
ncbi:hypothetical protein NE237_001701 [Protea cynaroides]|uniref:Uncharacterized protein n=1 Tax=Protea cynaroides TaxID=273540 RepID=A0A9Q0KTT9_9MAGN|nr:hypothetical protein NE237_001701 [Protea cynaroides]